MLIRYCKRLFRLRHTIYSMAKRDFCQQNQGSILGIVWNFLQPALYITILYYVFTLGFRPSVETEGLPFGLYLASGMISWMFFSSNLTAITNIFKTYAFLVKKINFDLSILPLIKIASASITHFFLLFLLLILAWRGDYPPGWHSLQLIYYYSCTVILLIGSGLLTASANIFIKDTQNLIFLLTQFGMWLTPIFWKIETFPPQHRWIFKANPAYYLINGYRDSITGKAYFWDYPTWTLYYLCISFLFLIMGTYFYKKLRPHFAEEI